MGMMKTLRRIVIGLSVMSLMATSALAQAPAAEANAALRHWMAFAFMQNAGGDADTADLLERVAAGQAPWNEARLGTLIDANQEALAIMQRASQLDACDWQLEYELGPDTPIAHVAKARVLSRLNALQGMRLAAAGNWTTAADVWLAGLRFGRHVAEGGSLVSALAGRTALAANLPPLLEAAMSGALAAQQRDRIAAEVQSWPLFVFDWGAIARREVETLAVAVDRGSVYLRSALGQASDTVPTPAESDVATLQTFMEGYADALARPAALAQGAVVAVETQRSALHPSFQSALPSLRRIEDVRAELGRWREELLSAVQ